MRVLNIEDDTFKHNDICKALSGCGIKDVEWSNNLADGWKQIKNSMDSNNPYDVLSRRAGWQRGTIRRCSD